MSGDDIEPGFSDPGPARSFVDGYTSSYGTIEFANTGSADGCPSNHIPSSTDCGTGAYPGWGPADIYHVSWGALPAVPAPEIYREDGTNAQQWYWLDRWSVSTQGLSTGFFSSTTQYDSCKTRTCDGTGNSYGTGYTQLYNALQQSSSTAQSIRFSTDFGWESDHV